MNPRVLERERRQQGNTLPTLGNNRSLEVSADIPYHTLPKPFFRFVVWTIHIFAHEKSFSVLKKGWLNWITVGASSVCSDKSQVLFVCLTAVVELSLAPIILCPGVWNNWSGWKDSQQREDMKDLPSREGTDYNLLWCDPVNRNLRHWQLRLLPFLSPHYPFSFCPDLSPLTPRRAAIKDVSPWAQLWITCQTFTGWQEAVSLSLRYFLFTRSLNNCWISRRRETYLFKVCLEETGKECAWFQIFDFLCWFQIFDFLFAS